MKKLILFIVLCAVTVASNAQTVKECFKKCPPGIFVSLDSAACTNICNLLDKGQYNGYITIFGDSVSMKCYTDNFISLEYSNEKIQLKVIDDMLVLARTVGVEYKESEVTFYDKQWNLKSSWIYGCNNSEMMPDDKITFKDLVVKPDTLSEEQFERLKLFLDPLLVSADLSEFTNEITLSPYVPMLTDEEKKEISPILKQKTFKWTNRKFK